MRTVFWTSFRFLTKVINFKQNVSCAECLDPNFKQHDSSRRYFGQVLGFQQKWQTLGKTRITQSVLTLISSNRTVAHGVLEKFYLVNKRRHLQANWQLHRVFWRQFWATGQMRSLFWTSFCFLTKVANFKPNDSCPECFDANFKRKDSFARSFGQVLARYQKTQSSTKSTVAQSVLTDANFEQQDSCARCLGHVLAF